MEQKTTDPQGALPTSPPRRQSRAQRDPEKGQLLQEEGTGLDLTLGRGERAQSFPFSQGRDVGAPLCLSTKSIPVVWGAGDGAGRSQHCQEEVLVPGTVLEAQILPSAVCPELLQAAGADPQLSLIHI